LTKLKDKVENALNEARMMILGTQVLIGFQFRSVLENGLNRLPHASQLAKIGSNAVLIIVVALLIAPTAFHCIVEEGEDDETIVRFTARMMQTALALIAVSLGVEFFVVAEKLFDTTIGYISAFVAAAVALFFWYGWELYARARRAVEAKEKRMQQAKEREPAKLSDKIKQVLTEVRIALPGAQALLGFQFAGMFVEGFDKLPASSKYVHFASLALIALSTILLIMPAAYHRIVFEGEDTEHFHVFAGRALLTALVPLALGICGSFFVVTRKVTQSATVALIASMALLLLFYGLWFAYTFYRRTQRKTASA
jgi:amino acid permease